MKSTTTLLAAAASSLVLMASAYAPLASAESLKHLWTVENFEQPESVLADPGRGLLYVSNIAGQPTELNGKGYISRLSPDGKILDKIWVGGLNAPKGMAISGEKLYVADMQTLHVVSLKDGSILEQFAAPEAKMLNDVTVADDGAVYVSDFLGGAIYKLDKTGFSSWLVHEKLPHPNGLFWEDGALLVGNWGEGINSDFSTKTPGTLYRLNTRDKSIAAVATGYQLGNLDGIAKDGENLLVSDWISGDLYQLVGNERKRMMSLKSGLADIGTMNGVVYLPMMMDGQVQAWQLQPPAKP